MGKKLRQKKPNRSRGTPRHDRETLSKLTTAQGRMGRYKDGDSGTLPARQGGTVTVTLPSGAEPVGKITVPASVQKAIDNSKEATQVPIQVESTDGGKAFTIPAGTPMEAVSYILGADHEEARSNLQKATQQARDFVQENTPKKRGLLLADLFLRSRQPQVLLPRKMDDFLKAEVRQAKRVVLDKDGSRYLGEFMRDVPDLIAQHQQYAIPPYEKLWVELDAHEVFRATANQEPSPASDTRLGYLFLGNEVYGFVTGDSAGHGYESTVSPIKFTLHRPWQLSEQVEFAQLLGVSRLQLVSWAWGSSLSNWVGDRWNERDENKLVLAKTLRDSHSVEVLIQEPRARKRLADIYYQASAGELRNIISVLLLMNQPQVIHYAREIGHYKGFVRGKLQSYLSHSVVSIHANPAPVLRKIYDVRQGSPHRAHEVRGHFCRNKTWREGTSMGCEHVTEQLDERTWECRLCHGKLWHRKKHMRGDASLGFVTKDYELTE